jgi:hypothetical protein
MTTEQLLSENFDIQIPLNSKDDIVVEILLIIHHGLNVYSKYNKDETCDICLDSLLNQYVLQYPCNIKHTFHRNCLLTNILNYTKISCPTCGTFPKYI